MFKVETVRHWAAGLLATSLLACNSKSAGDKAREQLAEVLRKKAEAAKAPPVDKLAAPPPPVVKLDPPYDEATPIVLTPDGRCPEGFWALFAWPAPGATPDEKKANEAKRKALADSFAGRTFLAKVRGLPQVTLQPYDAPKGRFVIDVAGSIDCTDSIGRVTLAWNQAKAVSSNSDPTELAQNIWQVAPTPFELPMLSLTEAKTFYEQNRSVLSARIAFTLGKTEIDKKIRHSPKVTEKVGDETITIGGGDEDWGAGRLVHATVIGIRVANDQERHQLFDQRAK